MPVVIRCLASMGLEQTSGGALLVRYGRTDSQIRHARFYNLPGVNNSVGGTSVASRHHRHRGVPLRPLYHSTSVASECSQASTPAELGTPRETDYCGIVHLCDLYSKRRTRGQPYVGNITMRTCNSNKCAW